jgi:hypothetical protein
MTPDLFWIPGPWRGRLAVANRPRGGDWLEDEASGWRRTGLDVVVSLLEQEEVAQLDLVHEGDVAQSRSIGFISFPIPDRGVPPSMPAARSLLRSIAEALDEGKSVAIHCDRAFRFDCSRGACVFRNGCREGDRGGDRRPRPNGTGDSGAALMDSSIAFRAVGWGALKPSTKAD